MNTGSNSTGGTNNINNNSSTNPSSSVIESLSDSANKNLSQNSNKTNERQVVDNILDGAGSQILQKMGVPEKIADKAIKTNGGKFAPGNSPITKAVSNKARDGLAKGLSALNNGKNNFGSQIVNNMPNIGSKGQMESPEEAQKAEKIEKTIKAATKIAKAIPIPQVQAAAKVADNLNKTGATKQIASTASKLGSKPGEESEQPASMSTMARLLSDPTFRTIFRFMMPYMIGFIGIMLVALIFISIGENGDLVAVGSAGNTANLGAGMNEASVEMYERILAIEEEYKAAGKNVAADKVAAVYHIIVRYDTSFSPEDVTDSLIKEIYDGSLSGNSYNEDTFRTFLMSTFFPKVANANEKKASKMTDEVFEYLDNYASVASTKKTNKCIEGGSCTYDIKGFRINGNIIKFNKQVSNLKVRLMQTSNVNGHNLGGQNGSPIAGEELIDFETYILGVNYAEIGYSWADEANKAFAVAARSFALSRPQSMGNSSGLGLFEENGQHILQIRNSVADQVFCHPEKGCSMDTSSGQWSMVYSGINNPITHFSPLPQDAKIRRTNQEVIGEVLVDIDGNIVNVGYASDIQYNMKNLADQGYDYVQILLETYASLGVVDVIKANCNSSGVCIDGNQSTGEFASWKQYGESWSTIPMGNSGENIADIGCLVTSIAIQIAKSGVSTDSNFNPGTFVEGLNGIGAFSGGGALSSYASPGQIVNGFDYVSYQDLNGLSKSEKLSIISSLLSQGYYPVCEVMGNTGQHWVAVDSVSGENILMMDPGSEATNMWAEYDWNNTSRVVYYKANK